MRKNRILIRPPGSAKDSFAKYKKKVWPVKELLQYLVNRVAELERKQCKPSAKCIFIGQDYLEKKCTSDIRRQLNDDILNNKAGR